MLACLLVLIASFIGAIIFTVFALVGHFENVQNNMIKTKERV